MDPYFKIDAINNSSLGDFYKSPALYKYKQDNPETETHDYFQLGTVFHKLILEPEMIQRDILIFNMENRPEPTMTMGAKRNKEWKTELQERATKESKELIDHDMYVQAQRMAEAVMGHPEAGALVLHKANKFEQVVEWKYGDAKCKSKLDIINPDFNIDLKSAQDAEPNFWQRQAFSKYRYHRQAGMYSDGDAGGIFAGEKEFFFIVCEKTPPYQVVIQQVSQQLLQLGIVEYRTLVDEIMDCRKTGIWPGYEYRSFGGSFTWEIPKWAE